MMNFWFNGESFTAVAGSNGFVLNRIGFVSPERDQTEVEIPGSSRVLTIDNGRYKPTDGYYQCFLQEGYQDKIGDIVDWLNVPGYKRLEDTMDASCYRLALFTGVSEKLVKDNSIARFDVNFRFAPERWLKSGEDPVTFAGAEVIYNPTRHEAKPKIIVHGTGDGSITIGGQTVEIEGIDDGMVLDSDIERAYYGNVAKDGAVTGAYIVIGTGSSVVEFEGDITSIEIVPRWWKL